MRASIGEQRKLIQLCTGRTDEFCAGSAKHMSDFDRLFSLAELNRVDALVYRKIRGFSLLPERFKTHGKMTAFNNAVRNRLLFSEARRIGAVLEKKKIPYVFLKGVALLALDSNEFSSRSMDDIDVLVNPQKISSAEKELYTMGYSLCGSREYPVSYTHLTLPTKRIV